jgi:hypothetical protein|tara:strand:- start:297 stop:509 length:213 start_codon:yes stop_codon:yes gene_type:complete
MSSNDDTLNYVFNNDYVLNNYREITSALRELKEEKLIEEETSLTEFSEKCFKLGLNEYLKKLYYYSTDFR